MFEPFSDPARKVMAWAKQEAQRFHHESIGTEHILLGLVREATGWGITVIRSLGVDPRRVRLEIEKRIAMETESGESTRRPETPDAAIQYAILEARSLGRRVVDTEHLLLGLLREHDGVAAQVLRSLGLTFEQAREEVTRISGQPPVGVLDLLGATARNSQDNPMPAATPPPTPQPRDGCQLCQRISEVRAGNVDRLIGGQTLTCALLADNQGCRGWCVVVLRDHVEHMDELPVDEQAEVFAEVARVARAIRTVFPTSGQGGGPPRINYECLGNLVPHVHWHVIPRHADDPDPTKPVWGWPEERLKGSMTAQERQELVAKLRNALAG